MPTKERGVILYINPELTTEQLAHQGVYFDGGNTYVPRYTKTGPPAHWHVRFAPSGIGFRRFDHTRYTSIDAAIRATIYARNSAPAYGDEESLGQYRKLIKYSSIEEHLTGLRNAMVTRLRKASQTALHLATWPEFEDPDLPLTTVEEVLIDMGLQITDLPANPYQSLADQFIATLGVSEQVGNVRAMKLEEEDQRAYIGRVRSMLIRKRTSPKHARFVLVGNARHLAYKLDQIEKENRRKTLKKAS